MMQAADILTKPFTSSEKWKFAVSLLGHVSLDNIEAMTKSKKPQPKQAAAKANSTAAVQCVRGLTARQELKRLLIEVCCDSKSKLSHIHRKAARDCEVVQFTEEFDLLSEQNRKAVSEYAKQFPGPTLIWV